ncbi:pyridoxine/pyridoxamine 5'-phosphate oxidase [Agilicoccus flavus]|uniref:pyridoxine/pyridoxamine 5'-phosphate oxidase n=1 Tax=Agilicoccus flavus TaxID=2775968 RepID=UPI001CF68F60|nr:pyridoxal 5'-phosphate synthase [Agilicoccus flavus]
MEQVRRWDYEGIGIDEETAGRAPWALARTWVDDAAQAARDGRIHEPSALAVATVDADGMPDVRVVLMRFFDPTGPGFVSSLHSAKAAQIERTGTIAAALTWTPLYRAVRFRGRAQVIDAETADAYWRTRPWGSRISARASRQSHPVPGRAELEAAYAAEATRWPDTGSPDDVPAPEDWVAYRIACESVEFWSGRPDRLHDRLRFTRVGEGGLDAPEAWRSERLQP